MVWGVALVDALYVLLSMFGVSALLQIGLAQTVVGVAGALLLVYFGVRYLRAPVETSSINCRRDESLLKSFAYGVGLTLTNPLTILCWAGVLGAMMSTHAFSEPGGVVWFAAGCITATLLFLTAVALAGHLLERIFSARLALAEPGCGIVPDRGCCETGF
jgi:threonine/homoserine/homoserine lactone efflux protein